MNKIIIICTLIITSILFTSCTGKEIKILTKNICEQNIPLFDSTSYTPIEKHSIRLRVDHENNSVIIKKDNLEKLIKYLKHNREVYNALLLDINLFNENVKKEFMNEDIITE